MTEKEIKAWKIDLFSLKYLEESEIIVSLYFSSKFSNFPLSHSSLVYSSSKCFLIRRSTYDTALTYYMPSKAFVSAH